MQWMCQLPLRTSAGPNTCVLLCAVAPACPPCVQDLVEASLALVRSRAKARLAEHSRARAEELIVRALVGVHGTPEVYHVFREMYRKGEGKAGGGGRRQP
jgi:hypothetical protein